MAKIEGLRVGDTVRSTEAPYKEYFVVQEVPEFKMWVIAEKRQPEGCYTQSYEPLDSEKYTWEPAVRADYWVRKLEGVGDYDFDILPAALLEGSVEGDYRKMSLTFEEAYQYDKLCTQLNQLHNRLTQKWEKAEHRDPLHDAAGNQVRFTEGEIKAKLDQGFTLNKVGEGKRWPCPSEGGVWEKISERLSVLYYTDGWYNREQVKEAFALGYGGPAVLGIPKDRESLEGIFDRTWPLARASFSART